MGRRNRFCFVQSKDEKESLKYLSNQMGVISLAAALRKLIFEAGMVSVSDKKGLRLEDENE